MQGSGIHAAGSRVALLFLKELAPNAICLMNSSSRLGVGGKVQTIVIVFQVDKAICPGVMMSFVMDGPRLMIVVLVRSRLGAVVCYS